METVFIDGVSSIALHNGVYRLVAFRYDPDGQPADVLEIAVPLEGLARLVDAAGTATRK